MGNGVKMVSEVEPFFVKAESFGFAQDKLSKPFISDLYTYGAKDCCIVKVTGA
jgi:hypothetical protein